MLTDALANNVVPKGTFCLCFTAAAPGPSAPASSRCGAGRRPRECRKAYSRYRRSAQRHAMTGANPRTAVGSFIARAGPATSCTAKGHARPRSDRVEPRQSDWLLFNVLEAERRVQRPTMLGRHHRYGRTYSGNVVSENDRQFDPARVRRRRRSWSRSPHPIARCDLLSMMPPGLLDTLADSERSTWSYTWRLPAVKEGSAGSSALCRHAAFAVHGPAGGWRSRQDGRRHDDTT